MLIRVEEEHDKDPVYSVNRSAFETQSEAELVDAIRKHAKPIVSLIAEEKGTLVGHIMFSPVSLSGHPDFKLMGLAPMAVVAEYQRKGVGSNLIREGLKKCRLLGFQAVVVLGHPAYYPRFGFRPSYRYGIDSEYDVPENVFMILELSPGVLLNKNGRITYHSVFGDIT